MKARVLVVEHEAGTGPGLVAERLLAADVAAVVVRPYRGDRLPADLAGWEGLVVCGGTMGPHDDTAAPWLEDVRRLLRHALARGTPVLGLCLGGQLLASVAGGRVQPSVRGAEVGLHRLHTTPAAATDPVFSSLPPVIPAVEWHWEEIVELPPGADALLESAAFSTPGVPRRRTRMGRAVPPRGARG